MQRYEYKVVPAPKKGQRAKGVRGTESKFAFALEAVMNEQGAEGWEYLRTDTLPCEERQRFTGKSTVYQNMLVFKRVIPGPDAATVTPVIATASPSPTRSVEVTEEQAEAVPAKKPKVLTPSIERVVKKAENDAPALGGAVKDDPGNDAPAPGSTVQ